MKLPEEIKVVEVGPRDGLQNETALVAVETKVALIDRLSASGLSAIEAGSFVSPKWVPQMADTAQVLGAIRRAPGVAYPVLVPNLKGLELARRARVGEVAVFSAASESFSRRNTNCSVEESLARAGAVAAAATAAGIRVRGYVSCALGCPYEGRIAPRQVAAVAARLFRLGCYEVSLGDTIGVGTPVAAQAMVECVAASVPADRLAVHFHDTCGQALANILACLERGIGVVDCAVAGLGGCPYAPGATGNVATEDVLYMLHGCGVHTGVDLDLVIEAGHFISKAIGKRPVSRVSMARGPMRRAARDSQGGGVASRGELTDNNGR